jgi:hypothetical protein
LIYLWVAAQEVVGKCSDPLLRFALGIINAYLNRPA